MQVANIDQIISSTKKAADNKGKFNMMQTHGAVGTNVLAVSAEYTKTSVTCQGKSLILVLWTVAWDKLSLLKYIISYAYYICVHG